MDCNERIRKLLEESGVPYQAQQHAAAYTAQRVAESEHVSGWNLAKVVIGIADCQLLMFVVSTPTHLSLAKAAKAARLTDVSLASEAEFESAFPDCEVGAMPPFGGLYSLPTFVDRELAEREEIVFQAGTHTETISLKASDYLSVSGATVADLVGGRPRDTQTSGLPTESHFS
jgi:Ala-tRNA(Pro) deacylase